MNQLHTQQLLRKHGMKATPQRMAIANLILDKPTHATVQQLYEQLRHDFPSLSQNTIYLTLASFAECGLLRRFHADGTMVFDSNTTHHHHAYCRECGKIQDIPNMDHAMAPAAISNWATLSEQRTWIGCCPDCTDPI